MCEFKSKIVVWTFLQNEYQETEDNKYTEHVVVLAKFLSFHYYY